jgi:hypothetical protein
MAARRVALIVCLTAFACAVALLLSPHSRAAGYWGTGYRICSSFHVGAEKIYVSAKKTPRRKVGLKGGEELRVSVSTA